MAQTDSQTLGTASKVDSPPRYHDDGSGGKLLRPENQVAFVADVAGAAGANPTQAEYAVAAAAINSLKTALVVAGIMKPV